jgi:ABC-2 type transport system ATP-binding protein
LQDIEALCSRVIMLDDGKIIYDGGLDELKDRWGHGKLVEFHFGAPTPLDKLQQLTAAFQVEWSAENDYTASVRIPRGQEIISEVIAAVTAQHAIRDMKIFETNTDEIVREIYRSGSAVKQREGITI